MAERPGSTYLDHSSRFFSIMAAPDTKPSIKIEYLDDLRIKIRESKGNNASPILNVRSITTYIQGLQVLDDSEDKDISRASFKALSDLLKYAAIGGKITREHAKSVIPILINRLGDSDDKVVLSAGKRLDDMWLINNREVQTGFEKIAFPHHNSKVVLRSVAWLSDRVLEYVQFTLERLVLSIVEAIDSNYKQSKMDVVSVLLEFLQGYFRSHNDPVSHRIAVKEIYSFDKPVRDKVLLAINTQGMTQKPALQPEVPVKSQASHFSASPTSLLIKNTQGELGSPFEEQRQSQHSNLNTSPIKDSQDLQISDLAVDLQQLILKLNNYEFDESITVRDTYNQNDMHQMERDLLPAFEANETENNWHLREKHIYKIRVLVRSNVVQDYLDDFKAFVHTMAEPIRKALLSLRTTLSGHACMLIKECAMLLHELFDSLIDTFLPALIQVCSSNKSISSKNAHTAISAFFINCSYSPRLISRVDVWAAEKNANLRAYCCTWLHIILLRFHSFPNFINQHSSQHASRIVSASKTLGKLLADSNGTVRLAARETFWCFVKYAPHEAEAILDSVDANVAKGIRRAAPTGLTSSNEVFDHNKTGISRTSSRASGRISTGSRVSQPPTRSISKPGSTNVTRSTTPSNNTTQARAASRLSAPIPSRQVARTKSLNGHNENARSSLGGSLKATKSLSHHSKPLAGSRTLESRQQRKPPIPTAHRETHREAHRETHREAHRETHREAHRETHREAHRETHRDMDLRHHTPEPLDRREATPSAQSVAEDSGQKKTPQGTKKFDRIPAPILTAYEKMPSEYPLVDQLTSSEEFMIRKGIDTLKYALKYEEVAEIPQNINSVLSKLSRSSSIECFKPMFDYVELPKILPIFNAEDILRICFSILPVNESFVSDVKSVYSNEVIYKAIDSVLFNCLNCNKLLKSDTAFGEQVSINKVTTTKLIVVFLSLDIDLASSDHCLPIISNNLLQLINHIPYHTFDQYSELLTKLYFKNKTAFRISLNYFESEYKDNIIDLVSAAEKHEAVSDDMNMDEPEEEIDIDDLVPNKNNHNDFPVDISEVIGINDLNIGTSNESSKHDIQQDSKIESLHKKESLEGKKAYVTSAARESDDMDIELLKADTEQYEESPIVGINEEDNVFYKSPSIGDGNKITNRMSQIGLDERNLFEIKDPYQSLVEKVDPLKKRADRNKQFNIYEDKKEDRYCDANSSSNSPVKPHSRDYDYSELNWFNFQLAHYSYEDKSETNKEEFERLVEKLGNNSIESNEIMSIVNYMQNTLNLDLEFSSYFYKHGKVKVEENLWKLFQRLDQMNRSSISNGLIVMKQALISKLELDLGKVLNTLIELSNVQDDNFIEYSYAISEIFDEILKSNYAKADIFDNLWRETAILSSDESKNKVTIVFELLLKLLTYYPIVNESNEGAILDFANEVLYNFLNHPEIEIRRIVVLNYSQVIKSLRLTSHDNIIPMIENKLNASQRKLIEYYSKN